MSSSSLDVAGQLVRVLTGFIPRSDGTSKACPKTAEIARIHRCLKARAASCPIARRTLGSDRHRLINDSRTG